MTLHSFSSGKVGPEKGPPLSKEYYLRIRFRTLLFCERQNTRVRRTNDQ